MDEDQTAEIEQEEDSEEESFEADLERLGQPAEGEGQPEEESEPEEEPGAPEAAARPDERSEEQRRQDGAFAALTRKTALMERRLGMLLDRFFQERRAEEEAQARELIPAFDDDPEGNLIGRMAYEQAKREIAEEDRRRVEYDQGLESVRGDVENLLVEDRVAQMKAHSDFEAAEAFLVAELHADIALANPAWTEEEVAAAFREQIAKPMYAKYGAAMLAARANGTTLQKTLCQAIYDRAIARGYKPVQGAAPKSRTRELERRQRSGRSLAAAAGSGRAPRRSTTVQEFLDMTDDEAADLLDAESPGFFRGLAEELAAD